VFAADVDPDQHFDGKKDVFAAALEAGQAQMFAATLPAYRRAKDWPVAVRASFEAMVDFLAAHPSFAKLAMVLNEEGARAP
jgi:AcrR family transcriptional regulator